MQTFLNLFPLGFKARQVIRTAYTFKQIRHELAIRLG